MHSPELEQSFKASVNTVEKNICSLHTLKQHTKTSCIFHQDIRQSRRFIIQNEIYLTRPRFRATSALNFRPKNAAKVLVETCEKSSPKHQGLLTTSILNLTGIAN